MQRIPRYALMLDDLFKETTEQHPEYDTVKLAAREMKQIAIYCDKSKSEQESNLEKLQNLQATLKIKVRMHHHFNTLGSSATNKAVY